MEKDYGKLRIGVNMEMEEIEKKRDSMKKDEKMENYMKEGRGENIIVNGEKRNVV